MKKVKKKKRILGGQIEGRPDKRQTDRQTEKRKDRLIDGQLDMNREMDGWSVTSSLHCLPTQQCFFLYLKQEEERRGPICTGR